MSSSPPAAAISTTGQAIGIAFATAKEGMDYIGDTYKKA
jgi:hypothetical protein